MFLVWIFFVAFMVIIESLFGRELTLDELARFAWLGVIVVLVLSIMRIRERKKETTSQKTSEL